MHLQGSLVLLEWAQVSFGYLGSLLSEWDQIPTLLLISHNLPLGLRLGLRLRLRLRLIRYPRIPHTCSSNISPFSPVFYVQVALRELSHTTPEREQLRQTITPIVYFLVLTSVVVHGITIPIGKGFSGVRRTLTLTRSTQANGVDPVGGLPKAPTSLPIGPAERYPHGLFEVRRDDGEMEMMDEHDFNEAKERGEELFISTSTSVSEVGREGEGGSPLKLNTTTGTGTGTKILTGIDHSHGDSGKIISANGNGSKKPETAIRFEEPKISNSSTFDGNHTYAINHGSTTAAELSSTLESDSNSNSYLSPGKKRGPIPNSILAKSVGMDADVTPVPSRSGSPTPRDGF